MASFRPVIGEHTNPYDALLSCVAGRPNGLALRHKYRGEWIEWQWGAVARSVDALAQGFARSGVTASDRIALVGDITPSILLAAFAGYAIGAEIIVLSPTATAEQILAATAAKPPRLAVIQERESLAVWLQLRLQLGSIQIAFDHAAPGKRHDSAVIFFSDLLSGIASNRDSAVPLPRAASAGSDQAVLWVEASTASPGAITAVFDRWLQNDTVLALPEIAAAAARDRLEIQPTIWLTSADRLTAAADDFTSRLPRRFASAGGAWPKSVLHSLVRRIARHRLGLRHLTTIDAEILPNAATPPQTEIFQVLAIAVRPWSAQAYDRDDLVHHAVALPHLATAEILL